MVALQPLGWGGSEGRRVECGWHVWRTHAGGCEGVDPPTMPHHGMVGHMPKGMPDTLCDEWVRGGRVRENHSYVPRWTGMGVLVIREHGHVESTCGERIRPV